MGQKKLKKTISSQSAFLGSRGRVSSPSAKPIALGEASIFPECHAIALGEGRLPRELFFALGEDFFHFKLERHRWFGPLNNTFLPRVRLFPECCTRGRIALGEERLFPSVALPREPGRLGHSEKPLFPECNSSPSATLGEDWLPRVLDFWHSGKPVTLGEFRFSRSAPP